jgi:hypothetical protein
VDSASLALSHKLMAWLPYPKEDSKNSADSDFDAYSKKDNDQKVSKRNQSQEFETDKGEDRLVA